MSSNMIERMSEELIALEPQLEHKAKVNFGVISCRLKKQEILIFLLKLLFYLFFNNINFFSVNSATNAKAGRGKNLR